jgi:hypothetical protein
MPTVFWLVNQEGRALGRHRRRWEDNISMDHKETWWEGVDWIHLSQGRPS